MDAKGQGTESFRLLIAAIMGLMILLIVLGIIDYFNTKKFEISMERFYGGLGTASQTPNGTLIELNELYFLPTVITRNYLAGRYNLPEECVVLDAKSSSDLVLAPSGKSISIKNVVQTNAFFRCTPQEAGCQIYCIVSLGKRIS
jgi:hypothetical protein